jgi:hypothetical protein
MILLLPNRIVWLWWLRKFWFLNIIAVMISTFAQQRIDYGARVYCNTMAQDGVFFKKAAELNRPVFQLGLFGCSVSGLRLCV